MKRIAQPTVLLVTVLVASLSPNLMSCGGAGKVSGESAHRTATAEEEPQYVVTTTAVTHDPRGFQGDDDDDDAQGESRTWGKPAEFDSDDDPDNDKADNENREFYDRDDGRIRAYGKKATGATRRALTSIAMRYYAAAKAGQGAVACSLHKTPNVVVEDYASAASPSFMRGAQTCAEVLSRLFEHFHDRLAKNKVQVADVRVGSDLAYVILGSRTEPAGYLPVARERGRWGIVGLLSGPLP